MGSQSVTEKKHVFTTTQNQTDIKASGDGGRSPKMESGKVVQDAIEIPRKSHRINPLRSPNNTESIWSEGAAYALIPVMAGIGLIVGIATLGWAAIETGIDFFKRD